MRPEELKEKLETLNEANLETPWSKEELWDSVASQLSNHKPQHKFLDVGLRALPWAAVVLCTIGFYWWSTEDPTIELETKPITLVEESLDPFQLGDQLEEGKQLIREACGKQLDICESPKFKSLYQELLQIEEEKSLLLGLVAQYGSDEIAIKALIQLENAESSVTGKLISLIMT